MEALQVVLEAGYRVLWSDMDTAWLKNFFELAPHDRDVVLVDDSEEENEQISENTCTGEGFAASSDCVIDISWHLCTHMPDGHSGGPQPVPCLSSHCLPHRSKSLQHG